MCEYLPVMIAARLGVQIELVTKQFSNFMPSLASRSMLGVLISLLPYALMACAAWSSDIIKTMLGGLGAVRCCTAVSEAEGASKVSNASSPSSPSGPSGPSSPSGPSGPSGHGYLVIIFIALILFEIPLLRF